MVTTQRGNALVWALVGLAVGFVAGWIWMVPPGTEVLAEGEKAVAEEAVLIEDLDLSTDLTPEQTKQLKEILSAERGDPGLNHCNWPDTCEPRMASELLLEIWSWVLVAPIDAGLKLEVSTHVIRCLNPDLRNQKGMHVCDLKAPPACVELPGEVWAAADLAKDAVNDPPQAEILWGKVRDEFQDFPAGR